MKRALSLILILFGALTCPAQKSANKNKISDDKAAIAARQLILKKQILVDEFDRKLSDVSLPNIRIYVRGALADWLWRDGKDETGRAEPLIVRAVEELYEKKNEIPEWGGLQRTLFRLLEINARETAQRLKTKYNIGVEEELTSMFSLLYQNGGDKIVADVIRKNLVVVKDTATIQMFLGLLQKLKSPEFLPVLFEIVRLQESGVNKFSAASLLWIADDFRDSAVPNDLKIRYYKLVLNKAASTLQSADAREIHSTDLLLFRVLPDIKANAPALAAEADVVKLTLSAKVSQGTKDEQELEQKINESSNKIETLISEADKTDKKDLKYSLLNRASILALKEEKFRLAVDLIEKIIEEQNNANLPNSELSHTNYDLQLMQITEAALTKGEIDSAEYALKRMEDDLKKADALRRVADYFIRKKDSNAALNPYDESLKLTLKADDDIPKYLMLLRLIVTANALDRSRLSEITSITARSINKMPPLDLDDKPGTQNYMFYGSAILSININLSAAVSNLSKTNRNEAVSFMNRINQKEIRVVADLVLAFNTFELEKKQIAK